MTLPTFERRNEITKLLVTQGYVQAVTLAEKFFVSMETIRKDLVYLEHSGIAVKEYGGARLINQNMEQKIPFRQDNMDKKKAIALTVLPLLEDAKVIFLDAGTTCQEVAYQLKNKRPLDIITNSLLVVEALDASHHNIFLTGGRKREKNLSFVGSWSVAAILSVHADVCILGTSGIMDRTGPTTHSYQEIDVKQAMIKQSDRIYVVADSDKFKESGFHCACSWSDIDGLVSDGFLTGKLYEKYNKIVPVIMAQEESNEKNRKN